MSETNIQNKITFIASIAQVKTMVDGGIRVTFDLPEDAIKQAAMLMECKRRMIPLEVEIQENPNDK